MALNSSVSVSTGHAPCELVFGTRVQLPIDVLVGSDVSNDSAADLASRVSSLVTEAEAAMTRA